MIFVSSFISALPSPPPVPGLENENVSSTGFPNLETGWSISFSLIFWIVVSLLILLWLIFVVYYFIKLRREKVTNVSEVKTLNGGINNGTN